MQKAFHVRAEDWTSNPATRRAGVVYFCLGILLLFPMTLRCSGSFDMTARSACNKVSHAKDVHDDSHPLIPKLAPKVRAPFQSR